MTKMLPKVELHLHLDCSLSYDVVRRLAPEVSRAQFDAEFVAPPVCSSLADFLTRAPRGFQLMQSTDALEAVTEDLFAQLQADGVVYAEIRFAPLLHLLRGLSAEGVVKAVDRATEKMVKATGIEARLILCTLRHFDRAQSMQTVELVKQFAGSHVVALDIAGDEAGYPVDAHKDAFRFAIEHGLHRTAHAGEAAGAESVWETLREFQPTRIGHGVRSVEDPRLVEHLKRERIHLEMCPMSNVQTRAIGGYGGHPVDTLLRDGVSVGISTDTRTITNVTLEKEYASLRREFGWGDAEFALCNKNALEAAFVEEDVKAGLMVAFGG
jgi:adenosine deaminase